MNLLGSSETQPIKKSLEKRTFRSLFGKSTRSMAQKNSQSGWVRWTASITVLLFMSAGLVTWLYPSSFSFITQSSEPPAVQEAEKLAPSKTAKGKAIEKDKAVKPSEDKVASPKPEVPTAKAADPVDELPSEAAAGQSWVKQLPPGSYLVRHIGLPVFKNVLNWQQANATLKDGHIVATYKQGDKLAQFELVTGPYATRAEAAKVIIQAQTPRFAYPITAGSLGERLSPRTNNTAEKPKEARR